MLLHKFKEFANLIAFGIFSAGLNREGAVDGRMNILAVTAHGAVELKAKRAKQPLKIAKTDRASGRGEELRVEFVGLGHDLRSNLRNRMCQDDICNPLRFRFGKVMRKASNLHHEILPQRYR